MAQDGSSNYCSRGPGRSDGALARRSESASSATTAGGITHQATAPVEAIRAVSASTAAAHPYSEADQLRVLPTASTSVSASTASTAQARNTETASANSGPCTMPSMAEPLGRPPRPTKRSDRQPAGRERHRAGDCAGPICRPSRMRPEGIEPSACGLKDRCSLAPRREPLTTELRARAVSACVCAAA
jgi:hypothetical protein